MQMVAISRALLRRARAGADGRAAARARAEGRAGRHADVVRTASAKGVASCWSRAERRHRARGRRPRLRARPRHGRVLGTGGAASRRSMRCAGGSSESMSVALQVSRSPRSTRAVVSRARPTFTLEADFEIDAPAIVGVMGPNGSGKTTLFEFITGSNQPTSGRVRVAGQDIHRVRYERARRGLRCTITSRTRCVRSGGRNRLSCSNLRAAKGR